MKKKILRIGMIGTGRIAARFVDEIRYVEQKYGKSLYFKSRVRESGERMDTRYISDEELRENIHMDITIED